MDDLTTAETPPRITARLAEIRRSVAAYVGVEAACGVLAVAGVAWWATVAFDAVWFWATRLEPSVPARVVVLILAAIVSALPLGRRLGPWLTGSGGDESLAATLERRRPDLDDRLMLALKFAEGLGQMPMSATTAAMRRRAIGEAEVVLEDVRSASLFDFVPLGKAAVGAMAAVATVGAAVAADGPVWRTWRAAYVDFEARYHPRETHLTVAAVVPPDATRRPLAFGAPHLHPRRADLELEVTVPESFPPDEPGDRLDGPLVPRDVEIVTLSSRGRRRVVPGVATGPRTFRVAVSDPRDDLKLFVRGGDYRHASPYLVRVVDPPAVESAAVTVFRPEYLGGGGGARPRPLSDVGIDVPAESGVLLELTLSKPLSTVIVSWPGHRLGVRRDVDASTATLSAGDADELRLDGSFAAAVLAGDGVLRVPLLVTDAADGFIRDVPPGRVASSAAGVLAVPSPTDLRIDLLDEDGVPSIDPVRFEVRGSVDGPPALSIDGNGVGPTVSDRVTIPLSGVVEDDHALAVVEASARVFRGAEVAAEKRVGLLREPGAKTVRLAGRVDGPALFETGDLALEPGDRIVLTVTARDGNVLTGPGVGTAGPFEFRVVTDDELLTELFNREVNLRRRFERAVAEVEGAAEAVLAVEDGDAKPGRGIDDALDRALVELRQNRQETGAVATAFGRIVAELRYNAVRSAAQLDELDRRVLTPLTRLAESGFDGADAATEAARRETSRSADAVESIRRLAAAMKSVLAEMQDLADLRESIRELGEIAAELERLRAEAERRRKKELLDRLGGGLFE
ncbi:MAG: hypothetical protein AAF532_04200 [Planctomycetota bacterium]